MSSHKKIEYVVFDMDGMQDTVALTTLPGLIDRWLTMYYIHTGLMIDSERVYTEVTSN